MAPTGERPEKDPRSLPKLADLEYSSYNSEDALVQDIIEGMKVAGACIIRKIISKETMAKIGEEMDPYLRLPDCTPGQFFPKETRKTSSMMSKSETYALNIVGNSVWQKVGEYFLTSTLKDYWGGNEILTSVSKPQLSSTQGFAIGPGARAQGLHRDDIVQQNDLRASEVHELGRDRGMSIFVAHTHSTPENGATRFIPGSHLWDYRVLPSNEDAVQPELQPGDAVMMLSGTYHAGSENRSEDDRIVWAAFMTRGWIRQEENQYLCNDVEKIKKLPLWLQKFCGYDMSKPFMGWVELDNPIKALHPDHVITDDTYF